MFQDAPIHLPYKLHCILVSNVKKLQFISLVNLVQTSTNWYILVHIGTYWYNILSHTTLFFESGWSRLAKLLCLCCTIDLCVNHSLLSRNSLIDGQALEREEGAWGEDVAPPALLLQLLERVVHLHPQSCTSLRVSVREDAATEPSEERIVCHTFLWFQHFALLD
jgi:hypothetical protein